MRTGLHRRGCEYIIHRATLSPFLLWFGKDGFRGVHTEQSNLHSMWLRPLARVDVTTDRCASCSSRRDCCRGPRISVKVGKSLGKGKFGIVYLAKPKAARNTSVALKLLSTVSLFFSFLFFSFCSAVGLVGAVGLGSSLPNLPKCGLFQCRLECRHQVCFFFACL